MPGHAEGRGALVAPGALIGAGGGVVDRGSVFHNAPLKLDGILSDIMDKSHETPLLPGVKIVGKLLRQRRGAAQMLQHRLRRSVLSFMGDIFHLLHLVTEILDDIYKLIAQLIAI